MELREIIWIDTGQQMASTWTDKYLVISRAKELLTTVNTVGYVIFQDESFLLLAQSLDNESGAVAGVMRIEKSSIQRMNEYATIEQRGES